MANVLRKVQWRIDCWHWLADCCRRCRLNAVGVGAVGIGPFFAVWVVALGP